MARDFLSDALQLPREASCSPLSLTPHSCCAAQSTFKVNPCLLEVVSVNPRGEMCIRLNTADVVEGEAEHNHF